MSEQERPKMAETWRIEKGVGLIVNEQVFPWHVAADPGLRVEQITDAWPVHILWVPMLIDAPLPEYGEPGGELVPESAPEGPRSDERAGSALGDDGESGRLTGPGNGDGA